MEAIYLETEGLDVGYNGKALIRDICLQIRKGEIVTLIGPNGAGKSTILKSITRQLSLLAGTVLIDGKSLDTLSDRELSRKMSVMLTDRLSPELLTCRDIVATGRYPYTGRLGILSEEDESIVRGAMENVHVLDLAELDYNAISDGQRQRVLLARALCQQPEILVLDEPTSYLDIRHKIELLTLLRTMAKERGITVVMSLHEIDLAQKISDRIVCVHGSNIFCYGTPEEVFREDIIRELYEIEQGVFDPVFGSVELAGPAGEPKTFVLSSCGSGIPVYRHLQKMSIPFIAGILYINDVDYVLARHLAADVITERPFFPIADETFQRACRVMEECDRVIDAGVTIGKENERMRELLRLAGESGKMTKI